MDATLSRETVEDQVRVVNDKAAEEENTNERNELCV